jgi:hypothetical protein
MTDMTPAIRALGTSDCAAMRIDPHGNGSLDQWRAARIARGCSVLQAITRENKIAARPGVATIRPAATPKPKPKGRTIESRKATAALTGATRRAACEMWENEQEARDGLCTSDRVDRILHRREGSTREAVRSGKMAAVPVFCPPLGRTVRMVRLLDVLALGQP